mgnify:CR=1 FL=1
MSVLKSTLQSVRRASAVTAALVLSYLAVFLILPDNHELEKPGMMSEDKDKGDFKKIEQMFKQADKALGSLSRPASPSVNASDLSSASGAESESTPETKVPTGFN